MNRKVAIVTGAGSGIGASAARCLLSDGWKTYDFSRRNRAPEGVIHVDCDVSDEKQVSSAVSFVARAEGQIDLLVNNAGFGISGAVEFTDPSDAHRQMDVNLFGTDNMVKAVLPLMRARGTGRIINLSSVAASLPVPFQAWYSASKAAINAYSLALANEVRPFGISVSVVMPGDIATGFTGARNKSDAGDDVYGGRIGRAVSAMEKDETGGMSPDVAGRRIARIARAKRVKPAYIVGVRYRAFVFLSRFLPLGFVNAVEGMIYR